MRRLVGKVLCTSYQQQAKEYLWPLQVGVAQPLGCEVGLQTAQQWMHRNAAEDDKVFLKLDFANAFNTVSRESFLKEIRDHMPGLAAWVDWTYGCSSNLVFGNKVLRSERGVQQGDPLGPLLFALALQPLLRDLHNQRRDGGLELVYSYLDDLCLAGGSQAVSDAVSTLRTKAADIGLTLSTDWQSSASSSVASNSQQVASRPYKDKCELILAAGEGSLVDVSLFPSDFKVIRDRNFELLGGPVGDAAYCNNHTQERVAKASKLLQAVGELHDPQVALRLLRHCAGFAKIVYSARVVPPNKHRDATASFDAAVRDCFERFSCLHPDADQWLQATLGTESSGLGLRSMASHAGAAFLASRSACTPLCQEIDPQHTFFTDSLPSPEREAIDSHNARVNDGSQLSATAVTDWQQKDLSQALDKRVFMQLTDASSCSLARRAHLNLVRASGAGLWLHALPSKNCGLHVEPALFTTMLQRWLRIPFTDEDHWCPQCDGIMDRFADHALVCCGGGDRTRRHNLIRNEAFHSASAARLSPELEKADLLPQRPLQGSVYEDGSRPRDSDDRPDARRPADVYIPRWRSGSPAAWDFAITSGLREDVLMSSVMDSQAVLTMYEDFKESFKSTSTQCQQSGLSFIPMIMEASGGGWGKQARRVWTELAKKHSLAMGELMSDTNSATQTLQRLSIILHRENARAILRRQGG